MVEAGVGAATGDEAGKPDWDVLDRKRGTASAASDAKYKSGRLQQSGSMCLGACAALFFHIQNTLFWVESVFRVGVCT